MIDNKNSHKQATAGFTLLEVLVALAILLIGLVSVLALFPQSLSLANTANRKTISAENASNVMGEINLLGADALYHGQIDPDILTIDPANAAVGRVTTVQRMGGGNSNSNLQRVTITVTFANGSYDSFTTYVVNP